MGLLRITPPAAPVTESDDEDLILAETDFDSYAQSLRQDDEA